MGTSSTTCCATATDLAPGVRGSSGAFMTACTRASCDGVSCHPLGPGVVTWGALLPRPSQMQRISVPLMIWASRPVSMCRISMKRVSKRSTYGGWQAARSAVPSHSIRPVGRLGLPYRSTYTPNSEMALNINLQEENAGVPS